MDTQSSPDRGRLFLDGIEVPWWFPITDSTLAAHAEVVDDYRPIDEDTRCAGSE